MNGIPSILLTFEIKDSLASGRATLFPLLLVESINISLTLELFHPLSRFFSCPFEWLLAAYGR